MTEKKSAEGSKSDKPSDKTVPTSEIGKRDRRLSGLRRRGG